MSLLAEGEPKHSPFFAAQALSPHHLLHASPEFIELLPVAAYACDGAGRVLWFNRLAVDLWGRAPRVGDDTERFCGSYKLYFGGRAITREETPMAHAIRTGEPVRGAEGIVERPDGTRVWAMVHIAPVKDAAGRVVGAINCFHDTTELHQTRKALQAHQDDLEDFFENGAIAMHIVGADGTILRANKAELAMLGYAPEAYIGRNIREFHANDETIADILSCLARGDKLVRRSTRLKASDGSIRHVEITSSANMRDGALVNTRCFSVDVTEQVHAKQKAAESELRFQQLLEALPAAVYTTDAEGRITYYNTAAVEMSGRVPEIGSDRWCVTWKLYHPDGQPLPHDECPMAVAIKENRPIRNVEALAEKPDGTRVPFLPFPTPLRDAHGHVVGAVNMLVDISERKSAEANQIMLLKELNHRVKNNMQMLQSMLLAAQRETADVQTRVVLADATRRVAAMAAAQQVLYTDGRAVNFDAVEFIKGVCATSRAALTPRPAIEVEASSSTLSNDLAMPLALILNELLTNAAKYAKGEDGARVKVVFREIDGSVELRVEDRGPGFTYSGEVRKRASGLGLVVGLATQIGGTFAVESRTGAVCIVRFPSTH